MLSIFCLCTPFMPLPVTWFHHLIRQHDFRDGLVNDPTVVPWLLLVARPAATVFHGLNMVLFGCCFAFTFCWVGFVVTDTFVICLVTVDALSIISSLSPSVCVMVFVACMPCEAFCIGAVMLVVFVDGGGFVIVIGDLCCNGVVSTGF